MIMVKLFVKARRWLIELWVRSQDRTTLIRSYEIYIIEQQNRYLIRAKRTSHILGSYSTIGRALEILDEIQDILIPKIKLDTSSIQKNGRSYVENGAIMQNCIANVDYINLDTYVYQMPEE